MIPHDCNYSIQNIISALCPKREKCIHILPLQDKYGSSTQKSKHNPGLQKHMCRSRVQFMCAFKALVPPASVCQIDIIVLSFTSELKAQSAFLEFG